MARSGWESFNGLPILSTRTLTNLTTLCRCRRHRRRCCGCGCCCCHHYQDCWPSLCIAGRWWDLESSLRVFLEIPHERYRLFCEAFHNACTLAISSRARSHHHHRLRRFHYTLPLNSARNAPNFQSIAPNFWLSVGTEIQRSILRLHEYPIRRRIQCTPRGCQAFSSPMEEGPRLLSIKSWSKSSFPSWCPERYTEKDLLSRL